MNENIICREENKNDYEIIESVIISDKFREWKDVENNEWKNIHRLRHSHLYDRRFSLVAEMNHKIVGHAIFVDAKISGNNDIRFLNFIQQSIQLECQGKGIGTKLVTTVENRAKNLGYAGIFVVGHKDFFSNLGYQCIEKPDNLKINTQGHVPTFVKIFDDKMFDELQKDKDTIIELYDIKDFNISTID